MTVLLTLNAYSSLLQKGPISKTRWSWFSVANPPNFLMDTSCSVWWSAVGDRLHSLALTLRGSIKGLEQLPDLPDVHVHVPDIQKQGPVTSTNYVHHRQRQIHSHHVRYDSRTDAFHDYTVFIRSRLKCSVLTVIVPMIIPWSHLQIQSLSLNSRTPTVYHLSTPRKPHATLLSRPVARPILRLPPLINRQSTSHALRVETRMSSPWPKIEEKKWEKGDATGKNPNRVIPVFYPAYCIPMFRYSEWSHKYATQSENCPLSSDVNNWSKLIIMLAGL